MSENPDTARDSPESPPTTLSDRASPRAATRPAPVPLIGIISLAVALVSLVLVARMDPSRLSPSRAKTPYYLSTLSARPPPRKVRLGSFNIRYSPRGPLHFLGQTLRSPAAAARAGTHDERSKRWGEAPWEDRREKLVDQVLFHELDLVGFQEVLDHQRVDLEVLMGDEFEHVGVGRDDGKTRGEAVPIFFRKSRFALASVRHAWLSPTPHVPGSRGWDAGQPRMVTIARLRDLESRNSDDELIVANTHWDDRGLEARTESARLILRLLDEEARNVTREENGSEPLVVLLGDLNSPAEEAGYQVLTGGKYCREKTTTRELAMWDSRHEVATRKTGLGGPGALSRTYGPLNTFTGFVPSDVPKIIDFVLVLDNAAFAPPDHRRPSTEVIDTSFLDADDPDEVLASIPGPKPVDDESSSSRSTESLLSSLGGSDLDERRQMQTQWKVSRYGVVPNFYEDVGGKRATDDDAVLVSDHRLVVVALDEVVA